MEPNAGTKGIVLVRDRHCREPLAPWPELHGGRRRLLSAALEAGVSFAACDNLLPLAPPLITREHDLAAALDLLERLLATQAPALQTENVS